MNANIPYSASSSVQCGPLVPLPSANGPRASVGALQAPGYIQQYAIGAPQWGDGVVTYPIRVQLWNSAQYGGYISGEPMLLDMSQIYVGGSASDAYSGSVTLRWEGPLTGWVMQSGQINC